MKYYFVSNMTPLYLKVLKEEECNILVSYYGLKTSWEEKIKDYPYDIFLDCGAFSAWTLDTTIDLGKYIEFVVKYQDYFERIAALDEIPGNWSKEEKIRAGEQTFKNYRKMKKYVSLDKLVPVYHFGEDFELLKQYVDDKIDVIGLGGIAGSLVGSFKGRLDVKESLGWFARTFETFPKQKFHGMGIFSNEILLNFPLYSTDSTHWLLSGRYGYIIKFDSKNMLVDQISRKEQKNWIKIELMGGTKEGFSQLMDIERKSDYLNRGRLAAREIKKYVDFVTRLWEARGIKWEK